jgi:hypothetical protein
MSYKTDIDKTIKILKCINPSILFINTLISNQKDYFSSELKKIGFSVYEINGDLKSQINKVQSYLSRTMKTLNHSSLALLGTVFNPEDIEDLFSGDCQIFSYIYLYPNNQQKYKERIISDIQTKSFNVSLYPDDIRALVKDNMNDNAFNKLTLKLSELNKNIYQKHLDLFDDKIFTVLI